MALTIWHADPLPGSTWSRSWDGDADDHRDVGPEENDIRSLHNL